ncbi:MAG: hypothetical protein ACREYE_20420, partial [Gammaproteobacteria bacterium]
AGQIAVLSRTVLARILRLDRRTGISAKEDLTAPPQTCRKDTIGLGVSRISRKLAETGNVLTGPDYNQMTGVVAMTLVWSGFKRFR